MLSIETGPNNPILRAISLPITKSELPKYVKLGKEMRKYIKDPDNGGIGLAAPQVGVNKRLIVVSLINDRSDKDEKPYQTVIMINPEILELGKEKDTEEEGCLSLPGMRGEVERATSLKVKFIDDNGKSKSLLLYGLPARIVQHEVDHIDGILFIDKLVR